MQTRKEDKQEHDRKLLTVVLATVAGMMSVAVIPLIFVI